MGKILNKASKYVDKVLKFIQMSFNTNTDFNFIESASKLLSEYSRHKPKSTATSEETSLINQAYTLKHQLDSNTILKDFSKYNKFEKLGTLGLSDKGLLETYTISNEILEDIRDAKGWLVSYKEFVKQSNKITKNSQVDKRILHEELVILGNSILARAKELCPVKTGYLKESGVLYEFEDYVLIAFTANYASYVHENLEVEHPIHNGRDCGGQAKFLELALQEFFPDRTVWVEHLGYKGVMCKIGINPLWLEYSHYG